MWTPRLRAHPTLTVGLKRLMAPKRKEAPKLTNCSSTATQNGPDDDGDIIMADTSEPLPTFRAPEIILLDVPPASTAPAVPSKVLLNQLVAAVEALTLTSIRMQKISQLRRRVRFLRFPWLLRKAFPSSASK